jgi:hypothetical protein
LKTPLPIDGVLPELVAALRASACAVLEAPTGAARRRACRRRFSTRVWPGTAAS